MLTFYESQILPTLKCTRWLPIATLYVQAAQHTWPHRTMMISQALYLLDMMYERSPFMKVDRERHIAWLPLNPYGKTTIGETQKEWLYVPLQGSVSDYQIKSIKSGKCLEVRLGSTGGMQDGDIIEQWDCSASAKNQIWKLQKASTPPPNPPLDTGTGELCNVCNPQKPECKPGAKCIYMISGQTICGQICSPATGGCPSGYKCTQLSGSGQTGFQCVPDEYSCPL